MTSYLIFCNVTADKVIVKRNYTIFLESFSYRTKNKFVDVAVIKFIQRKYVIEMTFCHLLFYYFL